MAEIRTIALTVNGQVRKAEVETRYTLADFEHTGIVLELEQLRHERDDERLRDGLAVANRNRAIGVRVIAFALRHEQMTRHRAKGLADTR